jgi:hypothetical protein
MGICGSTPPRPPPPRLIPREPDTPDVGLSDVWEPVKFLGRGGTGDTWLFK